MANVISTDKAPAAIGPYSQAIEVQWYDLHIRYDPDRSVNRGVSYR